jgi:hypothetical protein
MILLAVATVFPSNTAAASRVDKYAFSWTSIRYDES